MPRDGTEDKAKNRRWDFSILVFPSQASGSVVDLKASDKVSAQGTCYVINTGDI